MRILCFIDCLGSGGAQRQLVGLAKGFQGRGHEVRLVAYHPGGHFLPELVAARIPCTCPPPSGHLRRVWAIRQILRQGWPDVVLAFLAAPSLYAELAGLPDRKWGLVVGERAAHPDIGTGWQRWLRWPHRLADAVVTNSHANRRMLERSWPGLRPKLATICNAVDLQRFRPADASGDCAGANSPFRLVVAASYQRKKNMLGLARALHILQQRGGRTVVVDWYGATPSDQVPLREARQFVSRHCLATILRFHPPIQNIEAEYVRADAVGLFSEYEGLPNAICEGMACGKPIVMSDVCDARHLVEDDKNGFLCDPHSPASIANALGRMVMLTAAKKQQMGIESRKRAEHLFEPSRVLDRYETLLKSVANRASLAADGAGLTAVSHCAVSAIE